MMPEPTLSEWIEGSALVFITESYTTWRQRRQHLATAPEPRLSVGVIKGFLDQCGRPAAYRFASGREQYRMVQAALGRLVEAGKLQTSLGAGERGPEVKLYEPGERA